MVTGNGGAEGCDGAILQHSLQYCMTLAISLLRPGQKTEDVARDVMDDVPWCAAYIDLRTCFLKGAGINIQSRYRITPSSTHRLFFNL